MAPALVAALPYIISGAAGIISTIATNASNKSSVEDANQTNLSLNQQNLDWQKEQYFDQMSYNKDLQQQIFAREDTSYQRTKDDLVNAGYSPLAINGTNQSGSVVSMPSTPTLESAQVMPFAAQAPQFGQLVDAMNAANNVALETRRLDIEEAKISSDEKIAKLNREESARQFDESLAQQITTTNTQLQQRQQEIDLQIKNADESMRHALAEESIALKNLQHLNATLTLQTSVEKTKAINEYIKQVVPEGTPVRRRYCEDKQEYEAAWTEWSISYNAEVERLISLGYFDSSSQTSASSENKAAGGSLGLNVPGNVVSGDIGLNNSYGQSSSSGTSKDTRESGRMLLSKWFASHPVPVPAYLF